MCTAHPEVVLSKGEPPYSAHFDDHYYSRHDGRAETEHVFLQGNELPERWSGASHFTIGELGFGTGLNFLETWRQWMSVRKSGQGLTFLSVEAYPLDREHAVTALAQWPNLSELTSAVWSEGQPIFDGCQLDSQTRLHVFAGDAMEGIKKFEPVDAWYLDGFSPAKNPEMWSEELMATVGKHTASGGTLASYTAAGWVRRNLETAGFEVKKQPGFGTKRDMIVGTKRELIT